ncbi:MAG TPA: heavy-metal-associated domain-containing protein [Chitinophagaceae bacterium]|jgi:copper chaperone CopZ|nr:heavy-metal-associated domain-containing protein [Chitinophagaceae bacterium]
MKKLLLLVVIALSAASSRAQFTKATLQATGLTCAMCSNAINKALQKVPFVESVKADIKNSAFTIAFKANETVSIDKLKEAVEDAGFSIGSLKMTGTFHDIKIEKDQHTRIGTENFHFLDAGSQVLNGEQTVTVVDKNFVTEKQFKKYSSATKMSCMQTGKAASCCIKDGIGEGERVYHVRI